MPYSVRLPQFLAGNSNINSGRNPATYPSTATTKTFAETSIYLNPIAKPSSLSPWTPTNT